MVSTAIFGVSEQTDRPDAGVSVLDRDDFDRDVWSLLGLPVDMAGLPAAVRAVESAVRDRRTLCLVTPNLNYFVRAAKSDEARRQVIAADLSLADGAPIVAMARSLGAPLKGRCAGADLIDALRRRPGFAGRRLRVFFFGGREGSAAAAAAAINAEQRGLEAVGFLNPGFGDVESMSGDDIIDQINAAGPDFLIVALGAAKGDRWIERNRGRLQASVMSHLGAAVDFAAGTIDRAPPFMRRVGLEWAWRIKADPPLWRRYASDAAAFAGIFARRLLLLGLASTIRAKGPGSADALPGGSRTFVRIAGDFAGGDLTPVRRAFRAAAAAGRDVVLDISATGRLDGSFFGLVLMLEKSLRRSGAAIVVDGASSAHRRLFASHAMTYPQAGAESRSREEPRIAATG